MRLDRHAFRLFPFSGPAWARVGRKSGGLEWWIPITGQVRLLVFCLAGPDTVGMNVSFPLREEVAEFHPHPLQATLAPIPLAGGPEGQPITMRAIFISALNSSA